MHPDRFVAMASVPLQFPELAAQILEDGVKRLGMRGVTMGGHINGEDPSLPKYDVFWARASEMGEVVFMHPGGAENIIREGAFRGRGARSKAPIPVIRELAKRLESHHVRVGEPKSGPIFRNDAGKPMDLNNLLNRTILPALNRCAACQESKAEHDKADHDFERDPSLPEWRGWHAFRRGLATNLYRLGVPDKTIQAILRHANVTTTQTCYIKTVSDDAKAAMEKLETLLASNRPVNSAAPLPDPSTLPVTIH